MDIYKAININVPKALISEHKHDVRYLELIALSFAMKCMYGTSAFNPTIKDVMSLLHVGYYKAEELIKAAKGNNKLFRYYSSTNTLIARNYKSYSEIKKDKHGQTIHQMYCIKFAIREEFHLRSIVKEMRQALILCTVNVIERTYKFHEGVNATPLCGSERALTQRKLGNITGMSRSTARRYTNELVEKKDLAMEKGGLKLVLSCLSDEAINNSGYNPKDLIVSLKTGLAYIFIPNQYSTLNRATNGRFGNIIYNHKLRLKSQPPKKRKVDNTIVCSCEVEGELVNITRTQIDNFYEKYSGIYD